MFESDLGPKYVAFLIAFQKFNIFANFKDFYSQLYRIFLSLAFSPEIVVVTCLAREPICEIVVP